MNITTPLSHTAHCSLSLSPSPSQSHILSGVIGGVWSGGSGGGGGGGDSSPEQSDYPFWTMLLLWSRMILQRGAFSSSFPAALAALVVPLNLTHR